MAESSFLYVASQFATSFAGLAAKKGEIGQAEYAHQKPLIKQDRTTSAVLNENSLLFNGNSCRGQAALCDLDGQLLYYLSPPYPSDG